MDQRLTIVVEEDDLVPSCPHCGGGLENIRAKRIESGGGGDFGFGFGKRYAYGCPHCGALLGITHRKGFWMG